MKAYSFPYIPMERVDGPNNVDQKLDLAKMVTPKLTDALSTDPFADEQVDDSHNKLKAFAN